MKIPPFTGKPRSQTFRTALSGLAFIVVLSSGHAAFTDSGNVRRPESAMIGGVILGQAAPSRIIVRAIGPSLSTVVGALTTDPQLKVHDGNGNLMASNGDWQNGSQRQEIQDTAIPPNDVRESAIVGTFEAGNYAAIVRGANNSTGIGLIEIYKFD